VRQELGSYIPEDGILHSHRREKLKSYIVCTIRNHWISGRCPLSAILQRFGDGSVSVFRGGEKDTFLDPFDSANLKVSLALNMITQTKQQPYILIKMCSHTRRETAQKKMHQQQGHIYAQLPLPEKDNTFHKVAWSTSRSSMLYSAITN
jgi:hypothetical protein